MKYAFTWIPVVQYDWSKLKPNISDLFEDAKKPQRYRMTKRKVV